MRVLVATHETQGLAPGDFSFTVDGELVRLPIVECDCPDCGCRWAFDGLSSHKATTTAKVVERDDLDPHEYWALMVESAADTGFDLTRDADIRSWLEDDHELVSRVAAILPAGVVLGRSESGFHVRA